MRIWARLGVSIVILAVFGFFAFKALKSSNFLRARQKQIAIALAGAGTLLYLAQRVHSKPVEVDGDDADKYASPFYATGSYWGVIFLLAGAMVGGSNHAQRWLGSSDLKARLGSAESLLRFAKLTKAQARSDGANPSQELRLQGIGFNPNPARCSAIINGQTLLVGESAGGIKVLSINAGSVTVDDSGEVKVLTMK
jgi:hypothetical protein